MKRTVIGLFLWSIAAMPSSSADLAVTPHTPGTTLQPMKPGVALFHRYGDAKTAAQTMPAELEGLPALKAATPYDAQTFELSEPARGYWVFYPRVYTPIPRDWEMYRQRAFVTPFDYRGTQSDVYYKHFPAGKHTVANPPNRLVHVGFRALSQMTLKDCVLNIHSTSAEGVFRPGAPVSVEARVDNPTGQEVKAVVRWRIEKTGLSGESPPLSVPARQMLKKEIALPQIGQGFHLLDAELWIGAEKVDAKRFPVAILDPPAEDASVKEPFFPVGAYNKFFFTHNPEISRIYFHAICHSLRKRHLNTLVGPALDDLKEELEIAARYGVRILVRVDFETPKFVFGHPTVLAYMFGDEPKAKDLQRYKEKYETFIKEHPERPMVTAMVGESVGSLTEDDPVHIWKAIGSQVRMARFYPMRKAQYDLLRAPVYKNMLPPFAAFDIIERCSPTPWWYVIQGFGGRVTAEKPDPYWRNPTPEELTGVAHTALAFGARAVISWPLQTHGPEPSAGVALIAQETLAPEDGKYEALAKIAAGVAKAREVLLRHQKGAFDVCSDRYEVLAVPRTDPQTKKSYVYVVNMDTRKPQRAKITFTTPVKQNPENPVPVPKSATDLYSGRRIAIEPPTATTRVAAIELGPGDGQFWELEN